MSKTFILHNNNSKKLLKNLATLKLVKIYLCIYPKFQRIKCRSKFSREIYYYFEYKNKL